MAIIDLRDGDSLETALKKFKRMVQRENILREYKQHAYFTRPAERARVKRSVAHKRRQKRGRPRFTTGPERPPARRASRRTELPPIAYEDSPTLTVKPSLSIPDSARPPLDNGNGEAFKDDAAMGAAGSA